MHLKTLVSSIGSEQSHNIKLFNQSRQCKDIFCTFSLKSFCFTHYVTIRFQFMLLHEIIAI